MDAYRGYTGSLTAPAQRAAEVLPSEERLAQVSRAIYVGAAGDLEVELAGGDRVVFQGLRGGTWLPIRVARVLRPGTTAEAILALW